MSDTITGKIIGGRYRITGFQRSGRMGDVFVGRRIDTDELVSVKMLDPAMFDNTEAVKRFERETKITRRLDSPCTLVLNDYGRTEGGLPYMVLEYVEGEQLSDVIEAGRVAPERAAYIAAQIAMALQEAHSIGVVHRDLSPENVMITRDAGQADSVKVLDFGLSRLQGGGEDETTTLTAVGVRIGSPCYMAPEYIETHRLDHRADLYALGILVFEMITGQPPFTGRPYKVMDRHMHDDPPVLSSVAQGVPRWLDHLLGDLFKKDPNQRLQTAAEVIVRIEKGLNTRLATVQTMVDAEEETRPRIQRQPAAAPPPQPATRTQDAPARPEAVMPPPPSHDPLLQEFIKAQVLQHRVTDRAPSPKNSFVVGRVADYSIGWLLGVRSGWLVEIPDVMSGSRIVQTSELWQPVDQRQYLFASPDGQTRLEVTTTGADPGLDLIRSAPHVRAFYNPVNDDPAPLLDVWRQRDWASLEKLSWRALTQQRGAAGVLNTGLFSRFMGGGGIKVREHPALLLYGAALVEQGKTAAGMELIHEYRDEYALSWDPEYDAIAHFYLAVEAQTAGDGELALDLLVQSWVRWPSLRAERQIAELTGNRPDTRVWYGRKFPDYRLDEVAGSRTVHLYERLAYMPDAELQLVCMMGGFRGNPQYDAFMRRFMGMYAHFAPFVHGLHMVTHRTLRDDDRPEHYIGEDVALSSAIDFLVLEDYRAFVQRAVKPPQIPTIYALDREGWVVYEGRFDSVGLWDMLGTAAQVRMQRQG